MDIRKRLTRKPLTTALWTILVAAMAMLLGVGCALLYSSGSLVGILDDYHTSIAVRTDLANYIDGDRWVQEDKTFTQEDADAFEAMECVERVYFHTVSGGSSPRITPVLSPAFDHESNESYTDILVVGEVTELLPKTTFDDSFFGTLRIEEVILANPAVTGYGNYFDGYLNFWFVQAFPTEADQLQVGQRYVFFGKYDYTTYHLSNFDGAETAEAHPTFHAYTFPAVWMDGKLMRIENSSTMSYTPTRPANIPGPAMICPIEGSFAEFLADPDNEIYVRMIESWEKHQHAVPVIGTEKLEAMHAFANHDAAIVEGRTFTEEEYSSGARVCILSQTMASQSGIRVGDTIPIEQFLLNSIETDPNFNYSLGNEFDGMKNEPNIGHFTLLPEYVPAEEFTVVGLYRQRAEWSNSSYSFTPNTIFIPKTVQIDGAYGGPSTGEQADYTYGIYFSIKLKNGMVDEFQERMTADERFRGQFITLDQGFGDVMKVLDSITGASARMLGVVMSLWALLLGVYVLLYQDRQRRNVGIMRSLGAGPKEAAQYLFGSGMAVAAIGTVLGTTLSAAVMGVAQSRLLETTMAELPSKYSASALTDEALCQMTVQSQLPVWLLLVLMLGELAVFALVLRLHAGRVCSKEPRALTTK